MSHELREFITPLASPELVHELINLHDSLSNHMFHGHEDELSQLMNSGNSQDPSTLIDGVCQILRTATTMTLKQLGVTLTQETPYDVMAALLEALLSFEGADDYDLLLAIIDGGIAPDETLCEILGARTQFPAEDYMPVLESVDVNLIQRMRRLLEQYSIAVSRALDTKQILNDLNLFHTDNPETLAGQAVSQGIPPGVSMEDLYSVFEHELMDRPREQVSKDLIGLCLYAGVALEAIADEVDHFVEDLCPSLEERLSLNKIVQRDLKALDVLFAARS